MFYELYEPLKQDWEECKRNGVAAKLLDSSYIDEDDDPEIEEPRKESPPQERENEQEEERVEIIEVAANVESERPECPVNTIKHDLSHTLKSSTSKSLYILFGMCDDIKNFDHHRMKHRTDRNERSMEICRTIQNRLRPQIVTIHEEQKKLVKKWEGKFFKDHGFEPNNDDVNKNEDISLSLNKVKHCVAVLKSWSK
eukprot:TCONS_00040756-protein